MNKKVYLELLEKIKNDFNLSFNDNKKIEKLNELLLDKKVTYKEANELAIEVGEILKKVFGDNLSEDLFEGGILTEEIANILIRPNMIKNYDIVSTYSTDTQKILNKKSKIGLKAMKPPANKDRIDGIVKKISEKEFTDTKWLLEEPIINFTQSVVDDVIEYNAELQYNSGLRPKIVRKESGDCCDWCREVVGEYDYPKVPKDVYKRHRFCKCTVEYLPGDNRAQDVWSKKWKNIDENDIIKKRIDYDKNIKYLNKRRPKPLTDEELKYKSPSLNILSTKNYKEWEKTLTSVELSDISDYTGSADYIYMNNLLRGKLDLGNNVEYKNNLKEKIKRLELALSRYTTSEQYTVYRGVNKRHNIINVKIGESFVLDEGFVSSSFSKQIAEDFTGQDGSVLYRIRIPKNKAVGAYIDKYSNFKGEEEFLFKPSTSFKLLKIDKKEVEYGVQWIYDLEVE